MQPAASRPAYYYEVDPLECDGCGRVRGQHDTYEQRGLGLYCPVCIRVEEAALLPPYDPEPPRDVERLDVREAWDKREDDRDRREREERDWMERNAR